MIKKLKLKNSVAYKLSGKILVFSLGLCIVVGGISYSKFSSTLHEYMEHDLENTAITGGLELIASFNELKGDAMSIAADERIKSMNWEGSQKEFINHLIADNGYNGIAIADAQGDMHISTGKKINISESPLFKATMDGHTIITAPMIDDADKNRSFLPIATPIYNNNDKIVGRIAINLDAKFLNTLVSNIANSTESSASLINSSGDIIACSESNINFAEKKLNINTLEELGEETKEAIGTALSSTNSGILEYDVDEEESYISYMPIDGTDWTLVIQTPSNVVHAPLNTLLKLLIQIGVVVTALSLVVATRISRGFSKPLNDIQECAEEIGKNNLTYRIDNISNDEFGKVSLAINQALDKLQLTLDSVKDAESKSFDLMLKTTSRVDSVNDSIQSITARTEDVSSCIQESSASIQEISSEIQLTKDAGSNINLQSKESLKVATEIKNNADNILETSSTIKNQVTSTFEDARLNLEKSLSDVEIIKQVSIMAETISQIASQTNMLALNASIEAAKAGEQGAGFAIVAEEVRRLAEQSATTATEIQGTMTEVTESVEGLRTTSKKTLSTMNTIITDSCKIIDDISTEYSHSGDIVENLILKFKEETDKIAESLTNVSKNIETLSDIVANVSENASSISSDSINIAQDMNDVLDASKLNIEVSHSVQEKIDAFKTK